MKNGVSLIICCYNSASRIKATLEAISKQNIKIEWELILVDNNSIDDTVSVVRHVWEQLKVSNDKLNIIHEPKLGLANARKAGVMKSMYDYLVFIDDDNILFDNYVNTVIDIFTSYSDVGVCNGDSIALFDCNKDIIPEWFELCQNAFAVGRQGKKEGYLSTRKERFWGAGICFRRKIFELVYKENIRSLLVGRKGDSLTAGEDSEMCYWAKAMGYNFWYSPNLKLYHLIDENRLSEKYLYKMCKGFGKSRPILNIYEDKLYGTSSYETWKVKILKEIFSFAKSEFRYVCTLNFAEKRRILHNAGRNKTLSSIREIITMGKKTFLTKRKLVSELIDKLQKVEI